MPRKNTHVPEDPDGRMRINAELDDDAAKALQAVLTLVRARGHDVGVSQIVRASLTFFHKANLWSEDGIVRKVLDAKRPGRKDKSGVATSTTPSTN